MFHRYPRNIYACRRCRRSFEDNSVGDGAIWVATHLDAEVMPEYNMILDVPVPWTPPVA